MSWTPAQDPDCRTDCGASALLAHVRPRPADVLGLPVGRVLPSRARRSVGPFLFLDHMGPAAFAPGQGVDVGPHPHIHLATVTYLFEGELIHRDSLGVEQPIRPGDINWMTAGRGVVHSERTSPDVRREASRLHGVQLWVGLPREHEDDEPSFQHHPGGTLPRFGWEGAWVRLLVGEAWSHTSPVRAFGPTLYADIQLAPGADLELPGEPSERAVYLVEGELTCAGARYPQGLLVFAPGAKAVVRAGDAPARLMLLAGEPFPEPRHMSWNFVSSSLERVTQARRDWKEGRFPTIPGDDRDRVPLPE